MPEYGLPRAVVALVVASENVSVREVQGGLNDLLGDLAGFVEKSIN
jgi:hypothetical protein